MKLSEPFCQTLVHLGLGSTAGVPTTDDNGSSMMVTSVKASPHPETEYVILRSPHRSLKRPLGLEFGLRDCVGLEFGLRLG